MAGTDLAWDVNFVAVNVDSHQGRSTRPQMNLPLPVTLLSHVCLFVFHT